MQRNEQVEGWRWSGGIGGGVEVERGHRWRARTEERGHRRRCQLRGGRVPRSPVCRRAGPSADRACHAQVGQTLLPAPCLFELRVLDSCARRAGRTG